MMDKQEYIYQNNELIVLRVELKIISYCDYCNMYRKREKFILDMLNKSKNLEKFPMSAKQKDWLDIIMSDHYVKHNSDGAAEDLLPDYDSILGKYI